MIKTSYVHAALVVTAALMVCMTALLVPAAQVRIKREFLDEEMRNKSGGILVGGLSGEQWYTQQATRAVNQVRPVIRWRRNVAQLGNHLKGPGTSALGYAWRSHRAGGVVVVFRAEECPRYWLMSC